MSYNGCNLPGNLAPITVTTGKLFVSQISTNVEEGEEKANQNYMELAKKKYYIIVIYGLQEKP